MFFPFHMFDHVFRLASSLVGIGFVVVIVLVIVYAVKGGRQWQSNNNSPVLTVLASIVSKREYVSHYHHNNGVNNMDNISSSTDYYATFQFESGDRMEFRVRDVDYGMLAEGDQGKLTFQGTRFLRFDRQR